jgi:hypothetical protein
MSKSVRKNTKNRSIKRKTQRNNKLRTRNYSRKKKINYSKRRRIKSVTRGGASQRDALENWSTRASTTPASIINRQNSVDWPSERASDMLSSRIMEINGAMPLGQQKAIIEQNKKYHLENVQKEINKIDDMNKSDLLEWIQEQDGKSPCWFNKVCRLKKLKIRAKEIFKGTYDDSKGTKLQGEYAHDAATDSIQAAAADSSSGFTVGQ